MGQNWGSHVLLRHTDSTYARTNNILRITRKGRELIWRDRKFHKIRTCAPSSVHSQRYITSRVCRRARMFTNHSARFFSICNCFVTRRRKHPITRQAHIFKRRICHLYTIIWTTKRIAFGAMRFHATIAATSLVLRISPTHQVVCVFRAEEHTLATK